MLESLLNKKVKRDSSPFFFSVNIAKVLKATILKNICECLLLFLVDLAIRKLSFDSTLSFDTSMCYVKCLVLNV